MAVSFVTGSAIRGTGTSAVMPVSVLANDWIICRARSFNGNAITAKDQNNVSLTQLGVEKDGNSGFVVVTTLALIASSGYTPTITCAASGDLQDFDIWAVRGLPSSGATITSSGGQNGTGAASFFVASSSPASQFTCIMGYGTISGNFTSWNQNGMAGTIVTRGGTTGSSGASGDEYGISAATVAPGMNNSGGASRDTLLAVYILEGASPAAPNSGFFMLMGHP